jgi:PAS domain S-box-containing protein
MVLFGDGKCIDCNDAALKALCCTRKDALIGLGLSKLSPEKQPDGKSSVLKEKEIFKEILNDEKNRFEWLCRNMNGEEFWVDISSSVILLKGRQVVCTVWRDVTQQRVMEEKLRESEEKFRIFSLSGQDAVLLMDNEGNVNYVNPAAEKILGYAEGECLGRPIHECLTPGNFYEAQRLQLGIAEVMPSVKTSKDVAGGKALELIATRKDGKEIVIELSLFSEIIGSQWRIIGIFRDITERKEALEALQRSEERYRRLFEETKDIVFLSTPEGKLIDISKAGVELFGYESKEEILKINISRDLYCNPDDRGDFKKAIEQYGFISMHELVLRRKDGQKVIVSETANPVYDDVGNVVVYQGIMRDLTNIKELEQQLF